MLQKRILAAVLSLVMAIAMITPVTAAAPSEVEPAFFCLHNKGGHRNEPQSVTYQDEKYHLCITDAITYCTVCGKEMDRLRYEISEPHSYGSEMLSISHSGSFDFYTYYKKCSGCGHTYTTRTQKKPCTGDCQIPLL